MDVEKTIEFLLEQSAKVEGQVANLSHSVDRTNAVVDRTNAVLIQFIQKPHFTAKNR